MHAKLNGHSVESLQVRKAGLPPVVDGNTEIPILGTLPSDKSLRLGNRALEPELSEP